MKSNRGLTLIWIVIIIVAMCFVIGTAVYVVIGPNGVLNKEEVEPITTGNEVEEV